ncbi:MAG: aminomethyl-transferring glycine dehydrogenase subunit GcvPA [Oscillospiraceae bacterium]|nr:aminomethyl-transferring glycine dehydrogenase subunit GcvPA [Oscillospiraceae bacterium]
MSSYIPNTAEERELMLREAGYSSFDELYADIPDDLKLKGELALPSGKSEFEVRKEVSSLASRNRQFGTVLRGAGSYNHYIPSIVKSVTSKEEFVTAYTPYQPEISQGVLQSIFEYQTMICDITGLDVANASVYDGATAAAEAAAMCIDRKRSRILISAAVNPFVLSTVRTYSFGSGNKLEIIPEKDGLTDIEKLKEMIGDDAACVIIQQPNYYGLIEDARAINALAHEAGAKAVMSCYPFALALLETPAEAGADIAVGEGQPLGLPMSFGGPYLGFMAATKDMMRKLPGRIVGETHDADGNRAFVLTLQAREQHIRREKASSNICSNEALCAMTAAVYMSAVGPDGMVEVAEQCVSKAHYFAEKLKEAGLELKYKGEFFNEFVTKGGDADAIQAKLADAGILSGLVMGSDEILWCCTELCTKNELDKAASLVKEVLS